MWYCKQPRVYVMRWYISLNAIAKLSQYSFSIPNKHKFKLIENQRGNGNIESPTILYKNHIGKNGHSYFSWTYQSLNMKKYVFPETYLLFLLNIIVSNTFRWIPQTFFKVALILTSVWRYMAANIKMRNTIPRLFSANKKGI